VSTGRHHPWRRLPRPSPPRLPRAGHLVHADRRRAPPPVVSRAAGTRSRSSWYGRR